MSGPRPPSEEWDRATSSYREVPRHHLQYQGALQVGREEEGLGMGACFAGKAPMGPRDLHGPSDSAIEREAVQALLRATASVTAHTQPGGQGSTERHCWDPSPTAASQLCGHAYFSPFVGSSFQLHKTGLIISNARVEVVKDKLKGIIFRKQRALGEYMMTQLNVSYLRVLLSLSSTQPQVGDERG